MINLEDILVIKNKNEVMIGFNGYKLIRPANEFEHKTEKQIKQWFVEEVLLFKEVN
jgi:hypothetical protein